MVQKVKLGPLTRDGLVARLRDMCHIQIKLDKAQAAMASAVSKVKELWQPRVKEHRSSLKAAEKDLRLACEDSRSSPLLDAGMKSVNTAFGRIGWRKQPDTLQPLDGLSDEQVCERIALATRPDVRRCVRRAVAPDLAAIRSLRAAGRLSDAELETIGLRVVPGGEDWYYDLDTERLQREMEAA